MTLEITFRTTDNTRWGAGQGNNLGAPQIDVNFYNIKTAVEAMQTQLLDLDAGDITSISVTGNDLYFHKSNGDTIGPVRIPVLMFRWRGDWVANTPYSELDTLRVTGVGLFVVAQDHTSGFGDFDEAATALDGTGLYYKLFGFSGASGVNLSDLGDVAITSLADGQLLIYDSVSGKWKNADISLISGLDSLSDVTLTSPADLAVLRYDNATSQWIDALLGTMADQSAGAVAITGGTITGLPAPTLGSDAATKTYVDAAVGAGFGSIADGTLLSNISGGSAAPTAHTASAYFDHVFSSTQGTVLYRSATGWTFLAPGTAGQFLATGGTGADPLWDNPVGSGTVTSVASGTGLSGGPITSTGTLSLASIATSRVMANISGASAAPTPQALTDILDQVLTSIRGSILTRGATSWTFLSPGSSGFFLASGGAGADLAWANPVGSGTVTSVATGAGLTGGPITATGTISLDSIADKRLLANISGGAATPVANTLTGIIDNIISSTRGVILYRGATGWAALSPGTAGQILKTGGAGADPSWINSTASSLAGETDVSVSSLANHDLLVYNSGSALWENKTVSVTLDYVGSTQGDLLYRNGTVWTVLAPGVSGQALITSGASANPLWSHVGSPEWLSTCSIATTAALPACTYANGTAGVGATLTGNSNGALTSQDGITPVAGYRLLVKNQADAKQNGLYDVTQVGSGGTPFILTRATCWDGSPGTYINTGAIASVALGTTQAKSMWMVGTTIAGLTYVFGTDSNNWSLVGGQNVIITSVGTAILAISSVADKDQLIYDNSSATWKNQRAKYNIGASSISGVLTASQNLLFHRFSKAVTIPANFGAYLGHSSQAGGTANTTASTVVNVDKAPTATPNTFSNVGTITFAISSVTPTFASSGGAAISFAQGDVLRIQGPASADATFANFYATLVGFET